MWPVAFAVAALIGIVAWEMLPRDRSGHQDLVTSIARLPWLGPLQQQGLDQSPALLWGGAIEAGLALAMIVAAICVTALAIRIAIYVRGSSPVVRVLADACAVRTLKGTALFAFVMLSAVFVGSVVLGARPALLMAQFTVLLGLATLVAPWPALRPEHLPFRGMADGRPAATWPTTETTVEPLLPNGSPLGDRPGDWPGDRPQAADLIAGNAPPMVSPTASPAASPFAGRWIALVRPGDGGDDQVRGGGDQSPPGGSRPGSGPPPTDGPRPAGIGADIFGA